MYIYVYVCVIYFPCNSTEKNLCVIAITMYIITSYLLILMFVCLKLSPLNLYIGPDVLPDWTSPLSV